VRRTAVLSCGERLVAVAILGRSILSCKWKTGLFGRAAISLSGIETTAYKLEPGAHLLRMRYVKREKLVESGCNRLLLITPPMLPHVYAERHMYRS